MALAPPLALATVSGLRGQPTADPKEGHKSTGAETGWIFVTEKVLANGGFGIAHFARVEHPEGKEPVVLKEFKDLTEDEDMDEYDHELQMLRLAKELAVPNVNELVDEAEDEEGNLYLVLKYSNIGAMDQERTVAQGPFLKHDKPWELHPRWCKARDVAGVVVRSLVQVARALQGLHQHNILHRDVKAGNVFWSGEESDCSTWQAVLGDLGVAIQMPEALVADTQPGNRYAIERVEPSLLQQVIEGGSAVCWSPEVKQWADQKKAEHSPDRYNVGPFAPLSSYDMFGVGKLMSALTTQALGGDNYEMAPGPELDAFLAGLPGDSDAKETWVRNRDTYNALMALAKRATSEAPQDRCTDEELVGRLAEIQDSLGPGHQGQPPQEEAVAGDLAPPPPPSSEHRQPGVRRRRRHADSKKAAQKRPAEQLSDELNSDKKLLKKAHARERYRAQRREKAAQKQSQRKGSGKRH